MATLVDVVGARWEANYPLALGCAGSVMALAFAPQFLNYIFDNKWDVGVLFSSVFDLAAVATAFSFTFYAFIVTADGGFIGRMKRSIYYKALLRFTIVATILGGILVIASIPLMIVKPIPASSWSISCFAVAVWFGLVAATSAAFFRAARLFAIFASQHH